MPACPVCKVPGAVNMGILAVTDVGIAPRDPGVASLAAQSLTFLTANSMGRGVITYDAVKIMNGKENDCPPAVYVFLLQFVLKFTRV
jgi:xanthine/uracil/vitamin C permease (AzgA family)